GFAANLRFWRLKRKISGKVAAHKLGVAASTWCQWESGKRSPSVAWLPLVARLLDLPVCCFVAPDPCECIPCLRMKKHKTAQNRIHGT
ncbi:MAG: helix-turn-helix transcriptional regulator, partial [Verrucomicrobia bacterium]|nr:helix-turn-helix transcriptional regulator [Verrucomicrobiota bacterium]